MFLGKEAFGNGSPFLWSCHTATKVDSLRVSNGIYDEVKIDETLDSVDNIAKEEWTIDTYFDAHFTNNLEAGNMYGVNSLPIQYLRFKRRIVGELKWETMIDIVYDKDVQNYDIMDYFIENSTSFEYQIVPVTQQQEGSGVTATVETDYTSLFLTGRGSDGILYNYPLRFDSSCSEITLNEDKTIIKTLSSNYPAVLCGESKYLTGSITSDLISPTTEEAGGEVNMKAEKVYREAFENFLHSGKPMLIRNHSLYILGIVSEPKKSDFADNCAFGIYTFTMTFTETADATDMLELQKNLLTYDILTS